MSHEREFRIGRRRMNKIIFGGVLVSSALAGGLAIPPLVNSSQELSTNIGFKDRVKLFLRNTGDTLGGAGKALKEVADPTSVR